jgi:hypothetical protein
VFGRHWIGYEETMATLGVSLGGGIAIIVGIAVAAVVLGFLGHFVVARLNERKRPGPDREAEHPRGRVGRFL